MGGDTASQMFPVASLSLHAEYISHRSRYYAHAAVSNMSFIIRLRPFQYTSNILQPYLVRDICGTAITD